MKLISYFWLNIYYRQYLFILRTGEFVDAGSSYYTVTYSIRQHIVDAFENDGLAEGSNVYIK